MALHRRRSGYSYNLLLRTCSSWLFSFPQTDFHSSKCKLEVPQNQGTGESTFRWCNMNNWTNAISVQVPLGFCWRRQCSHFKELRHQRRFHPACCQNSRPHGFEGTYIEIHYMEAISYRIWLGFQLLQNHSQSLLLITKSLVISTISFIYLALSQFDTLEAVPTPLLPSSNQITSVEQLHPFFCTMRTAKYTPLTVTQLEHQLELDILDSMAPRQGPIWLQLSTRIISAKKSPDPQWRCVPILTGLEMVVVHIRRRSDIIWTQSPEC